MATNKTKEKETAAAQAAPTPEKQEAQPATVNETSTEKKAAIARHGFKEVFVTSDGQAFPLRSDAQHHAADLAGKEIIKVTE